MTFRIIAILIPVLSCLLAVVWLAALTALIHLRYSACG